MTIVLTKKEVKNIVRREVAMQILEHKDFFIDPDAGLELSLKAKRRLAKSRIYNGGIS